MLHLLREKGDEAVILGKREEKRPMDTLQEIRKMMAIRVRRGALQQRLAFWRVAIVVTGSNVHRILRGMGEHGWRLAIAKTALQARRLDVARPPNEERRQGNVAPPPGLFAAGRFFHPWRAATSDPRGLLPRPRPQNQPHGSGGRLYEARRLQRWIGGSDDRHGRTYRFTRT